MAQPVKAAEPSMDEILASIRRIIADDDTSKPPASPAGAAGAAGPTADTAGHLAAAATLPTPARPTAAAPGEASTMSQAEVDAVLSGAEQPKAGNKGAPPAAETEEPVLELTEAMVARETTGSTFRTIEPESDVVFSDSSPAMPASPPAASSNQPVRANPRNRLEESLLSTATNAAVDSAFQALARTVLVENSRTLEDLVREMLRPMLKSWLDDNLPTLVERLVRAEIERVSRGRG